MIELVFVFMFDSLHVQQTDTLKKQINRQVDRIEMQQMKTNVLLDSLFKLNDIDTTKIKFRKLK